MAINSQFSKTGNFGQPETAEVKNIVFIDGAVDEARMLWNDLDGAAAAVILDPDRDGVVQITQYLLEYIKHEGAGGNLHIVSHGAPGCLYLGNTQLSLDTLEHYWGDLQQWQVDSLLLYGCHVAAGDAGEEFLAKLHAATGANLGASNSKTGNASKGGNWNLEATVPEVNCPVVFSQAVQNAYPGVLEDVTVSITADTVDGDTSSISALIATPGADGGISLREAVIAANNTAGDDTIILTSGSTYTLSRTGTLENSAVTGDLDIANNGKITIYTTGAGAAVIDGNDKDRVFDVRENASLALDNVEVTRGNATTGSSEEKRGGGIRVNSNGTLELTNSTVSGNTARDGGGINNNGGTASIANSTVSGNTANNGGGIFNASSGTVSIANSTVSGNTANNGGGINNGGEASIANSTVSGNTTRDGGGIKNSGTASIANSTVSGNTANNGGGINSSGTASIANSTVSGNTAYFKGGGIYIYNGGEASIANSTVSGNTARDGGGIYNGGEASIANSTVSGNTAARDGGGIYNGGTASIANSTVSGNTASSGGGIYNRYGEASIANSTVSGNTAANRGGGIYNRKGEVSIANSTVSGNTASSGGGIYNHYYKDSFDGYILRGTARIANSIIAANADNKDLHNNSSTFYSGGHNLIGNNDGITAFTDGANGDIVGDAASPVDPMLGPLQNNGGPTKTRAPMAESPALDNVSSAGGTDQRGVTRPQNGPADIGAVEKGGTPNYIVVDITTDENDGTLENNRVSLRDAIIYANSNAGDFIIQLEGGKTYNLSLAGTGANAGDLDIANNGKITIETIGAGPAVIDARGIDRVFDVWNGASLALENVEVTGGNTSGDGGGIFVNSNGTLELGNSTVSGNRAADDGGGISNNGGTVSIANNSTVSGNTAADAGGGIFNISLETVTGTVSIANSTVSGNTAEFGGGIFNQSGTVSIANSSTVSGNTARLGGGINNSSGTASIENSTVSGNTAQFGGGINNSSGTVSIANSSTVRDNTASFGGGIRNSSGTASIDNSTVSGNTASFGGGIYNFQGTASIANSSTVRGNRASFGGGIRNSSGTASIDNSTVSGNTASFGGGIYNFQGTASIANSSTVSGNRAADDGGGISNNGGTVSIQNSEVSGNTAADNGGGIYNISSGTVSIANSSTVRDNRAADYGGGIFNQSGTVSIANSSTVRDNTASWGGGIYNSSGTASIANSTVSGNTAANRGGGIYNYKGTASIANSSTVSGNRAADDGGGINNFQGTVSIQNSEVSGNRAADNGGGIYNISSGTVSIANSSTVRDNRAADNGGGIFNSGTASIANSTVSGNTARDGGGIENYQGTASIANSTVSGNTARDGGGLDNYKGTASIANSTVSGNTAANRGGGINNNGGTASIANSTVSGNTAARYGGGLDNRSGTASIANSTVSGNGARDGGGIENYQGTASIANSTVSGNTAARYGGGLDNYKGTAIIANSIIAANADDKDLNNSSGIFTSDGYNLIGNGDGIAGFTDADIVGTAASPVDPMLGPLQNNGGDTFTHALLAGSPAINAGNNDKIPTDELDVDGDGNTTEAISIDQRGETRIQRGTVDLGASESGFVDDTPPTVTNLASNLTTINDSDVGAGTFTLTVDFSERMNTSVNPTIAFPTAGEDPTSTLTFNGGSWSDRNTYVATYNVVDANETINDIDVQITGARDVAGNGQTTSTQSNVFSIDMASQIEFSAASYNSNEDAGTSNDVTLTRTGDTSGASTVQVSITGGTATGGGTDYNSSSFPLTVEFAATETSKTVAVEIVDDNVYEPGAAETIIFSLASGSNSNIGTQSTTTLNISDNDSQPTISINDVTVNENAGSASFTVSLNAPSAQTITVDYATADGTAVAGDDYTSTSGTLTFNPGETTQNITVNIASDSIDEENETFSVDLVSPTNATIADSEGISTITDDDTAGVTIAETSGSTSVGEGGATDTYMVVLDTQPTADVIVNITPDSQTTVDMPSLTFTSSNWDTEQTVTVTADDDSTVEGAHSSTITHAIAAGSAAEYTGVSINNVTVNITDNDSFNDITGTSGSENITGTSGPDRITGGLGRDDLTGGAGSDEFVYTQLRDVGDTIMDFIVGEDNLSLRDLFTSLSQSISDLATAKSLGFISFIDRSPDTLVMLDPDGTGGRGRGRPLVTISGVLLADMDNEVNFIF